MTSNFNSIKFLKDQIEEQKKEIDFLKDRIAKLHEHMPVKPWDLYQSYTATSWNRANWNNKFVKEHLPIPRFQLHYEKYELDDRWLIKWEFNFLYTHHDNLEIVVIPLGETDIEWNCELFPKWFVEGSGIPFQLTKSIIHLCTQTKIPGFVILEDGNVHQITGKEIPRIQFIQPFERLDYLLLSKQQIDGISGANSDSWGVVRPNIN